MPDPRPPVEQLPGLLQQVFGHGGFRAHQQEVCEAAAAGRDVLLVMPTGAGKSLCYQLPALARGGTALVISPLIALMDDQASKLSDLGLRVARVHSGLSRHAARHACRDYLDGQLDFLFIAPERMRVPGFPEMLARRKPSLVAIDEAHCISQWGHDFRPDYRTLGGHLPALRPAPLVALTATATPTVQRDIAAQLDLQDPAIFITGFRRENIAVEVIELSKPQRPEFAAKLLADPVRRPAIIYAPSRKAADELAEKLGKSFPAKAYHAGLEAGTRERIQRAFLGGEIEVIVATVAFGMGVDKADVRTVVHVALPGSVEGYYQEIGRAGRDGKPSRAVLLHSFADRRTQEFFLERSYPARSELERVEGALDGEFQDVADLQRRLKMDSETLDRVIEKLAGQGAAVLDMQGAVRGTGELGWQRSYDGQIAARRTQIDRMVGFAEGTVCRMQALVEHFGDKTDRRGACGHCDICQPGSGSGPAAHQPVEDERRKLRTILKALEGRGTSAGKLFTDLALTRERKDFDALLDGLAKAGLVDLATDTFRAPDGRDVSYRKVTITHEGRTPDETTLDTVWLRGDGGTGVASAGRSSRKPKTAQAGRGRSSGPVEDAMPLTVEAQRLAANLRAWRSERAKAAGKPAFLVFADRALDAIAQRAPRTLSELAGVPGVGEMKLEQYGAEVLAICRGDAATPKMAAETSILPMKPTAQRTLPPAREPNSRSLRDPAVRRGEPGSRDAGTAKPAAARPTIVRAPGADVSKAKPAAAAVFELSAAQQELAGRLQAWRQQQAASAGLPSFFILSDSHLRSIAVATPRSLDELRGLPGLGPEKVERFGAAVLELCLS